MSICIFFGYFQWLEQIINIEKFFFGAVTWVGLLPKQYCGENILYFNRGDCIAEIVLQYGRLEGLEGIEIVLQYTKCIVTEREGEAAGPLYCNTVNCIARECWWKLYCNIILQYSGEANNLEFCIAGNCIAIQYTWNVEC